MTAATTGAEARVHVTAAAGWTRTRGAALALSGVLIGVGGVLHPHTDTHLDYDHAVAGMLHDGTWPWTHAMTLLGLLLLAGTLAVSVRIAGATWPRPVRIAAWALTTGAILGAVGVLVTVLREPALSPLFAGAAGIAVWLVAAGVRAPAGRRQ